MDDEKRLEIQEEEMDFIEKCVEEAPTSELANTGIEVDGKGDEGEGK